MFGVNQEQVMLKDKPTALPTLKHPSSWKKNHGIYSVNAPDGQIIVDQDQEDDDVKTDQKTITIDDITVADEVGFDHATTGHIVCGYCGIQTNCSSRPSSDVPLTHPSETDVAAYVVLDSVKFCSPACLATMKMMLLSSTRKKHAYAQLDANDQVKHSIHHHYEPMDRPADVCHKQLAAHKVYLIDNIFTSSCQFPPEMIQKSDDSSLDFDCNDDGFITTSLDDSSLASRSAKVRKMTAKRDSVELSHDPIIRRRFTTDEMSAPLGLKAKVNFAAAEYITNYWGSVNTSTAVDKSTVSSSRLVDLSVFDVDSHHPFVLDGSTDCMGTYANDPFGCAYLKPTDAEKLINARLIHNDSPFFSWANIKKIGFVPTGAFVIQAIKPIRAGDFIYISYGERYWHLRQLYGIMNPQVYQLTQLSKSKMPLIEMCSSNERWPRRFTEDIIQSVKMHRDELDEYEKKLPGMSISRILFDNRYRFIKGTDVEYLLVTSSTTSLHCQVPAEDLTLNDTPENQASISSVILNTPMFNSFRHRTLMDAKLTTDELAEFSDIMIIGVEHPTLKDINQYIARVHEEKFQSCFSGDDEYEGVFGCFDLSLVPTISGDKVKKLEEHPSWPALLQGVDVEVEVEASKYRDLMKDFSSSPLSIFDKIPIIALSLLFPEVNTLDKLQEYHRYSSNPAMGKTTKAVSHRVHNKMVQHLHHVLTVGDWLSIKRSYEEPKQKRATKKQPTKKRACNRRSSKRDDENVHVEEDEDIEQPWMRPADVENADGEAVQLQDLWKRTVLEATTVSITRGWGKSMIHPHLILASMCEDRLITEENMLAACPSMKQLDEYQQWALALVTDSTPSDLVAKFAPDADTSESDKSESDKKTREVIECIARWIWVCNEDGGEEQRPPYWPYAGGNPNITRVEPADKKDLKNWYQFKIASDDDVKTYVTKFMESKKAAVEKKEKKAKSVRKPKIYWDYQDSSSSEDKIKEEKYDDEDDVAKDDDSEKSEDDTEPRRSKRQRTSKSLKETDDLDDEIEENEFTTTSSKNASIIDDDGQTSHAGDDDDDDDDDGQRSHAVDDEPHATQEGVTSPVPDNEEEESSSFMMPSMSLNPIPLSQRPSSSILSSPSSSNIPSSSSSSSSFSSSNKRKFGDDDDYDDGDDDQEGDGDDDQEDEKENQKPKKQKTQKETKSPETSPKESPKKSPKKRKWDLEKLEQMNANLPLPTVGTARRPNLLQKVKLGGQSGQTSTAPR
jgi:hypothetical protein